MRHILKRTGIFFHQQTGNRLRDFPEAIYDVLVKDNVLFYDVLGDPLMASGSDMYIDYDLMHRVHSSGMIEQIASQDAFEGILISGFSTVWSSVKIFSGEIDNAFVFTGFGDHHAGRETFGGGCYLNGAAMAVSELRERFGVGRVAIIDTDAHHGDGTWDIFKDDSQTLYACFCQHSHVAINNNVNIKIPAMVNDLEYMDLVQQRFLPTVFEFKPEIIFWNWGYDGTQGDYGSMGLSPHVHVQLAAQLKSLANKLTESRLVVVLCGGSRRDYAAAIIPELVELLSES